MDLSIFKTINILDAIVVLILIIGIISGAKRGLLGELILFMGIVGVFIAAWFLRVPVSTYLYKHLPFFGFKGMFKGVSVLNILVYELIAFFAVLFILILLLKLLLKITGLLESVIHSSSVLGPFSRMCGGALGFVEGVIVCFLVCGICSLPFVKFSDAKSSRLRPMIINNTPYLSKSIGKSKMVYLETTKLADKYKKKPSKMNEEIMNLFIKYDIITQENLDYLKKKGKL